MKKYLYNQFKKTAKNSYFYHQIKKPKNSTVKFFNFLKKNKCLKGNIIDCACGNGANLIYLQKKYRYSKSLLGIEFNKILVKQSKKYLKNLKNIKV